MHLLWAAGTPAGHGRYGEDFRMRVKSLLPFAAAGAIVLAAGAANATVVGYTTVSSFVAASNNTGLANQVADNVNWGVFADTLHTARDGGSIPTPSSMTTVAGENITATAGDGTAFTTYVQGQSATGQFATGTTVLGTSATLFTQPITLAFATAVDGVGLHVEAGDPGSYTFTITAYNSSMLALGTVTNTGSGNGVFGTGNTPGTAAFGGLISNAYNISYVTIAEGPSLAGSGFAIDTSLIYHTNINGRSNPDAQQGSSQTPEPGTLSLLGAGLAGLGYVRRRLRRKA